jgi:hypothetical protein
VTNGHGHVGLHQTVRGAGAPDLEDIADDLARMLQYEADLRGIDP